MSRLTPEQIDKLLPQTQCGLCGYGGCMPYAEAMAFEQASIHLCPPGGVKTLMALGELLNQDPTPFIAEMEVKTKLETKAVIRENECIGCTKCIQACPVDAILGSAKQMHTIIQMECTGCELCIPACPVDCIDLLSPIPATEKIQTAKADLSRGRFQIREQRLLKEKQIKQVRHHTLSLGEKKDYVQEALARALAKKNKVSESK